jgi:hypothetical protein
MAMPLQCLYYPFPVNAFSNKGTIISNHYEVSFDQILRFAVLLESPGPNPKLNSQLRSNSLNYDLTLKVKV